MPRLTRKRKVAAPQSKAPALGEVEARISSAANTQSEASSNEETSSLEEHSSSAKFKFKQRVYAKDTETGILYEAVIRRFMYATQHQRQLKLNADTSEDCVRDFFEREPQAKWWYFVHYSGWNVKWDRWIEEDHLFEATDSTKAFAKRLATELSAIRSEARKKYSGPKAKVQVALELDRRIVEMEREHRMEERRKELAAKGEAMQKADLFKDAEKNKKSKWTKSSIQKEMMLREKHLQSRRAQQSSELLVLPFALKKIMVEEWEIVTQCRMCANLPAAVTVRQALEHFFDYKMDSLKVGQLKENGEHHAKNVSIDETDGRKAAVAREWREMVDGVCLFFDQAIPERLLYGIEMIQYSILQSKGEYKCSSNIYGKLITFVKLFWDDTLELSCPLTH